MLNVLLTLFTALVAAVTFVLPGLMAGIISVAAGIVKKRVKMGLVGLASCIVAYMIGVIILRFWMTPTFIPCLILPLLTAGLYVWLIWHPNSDIFEKRILSYIENNAIIIFLLLLAVVVGVLRPTFVSFANLKNLAMNTSVRFIIALGVSGCLITKGTDLSAGRMVGLAACLAATLLQKGDYGDKFFPNMGEPNMFLIFFLVILAGGILGATNGSIISFLNVPPFLASLGMQTIVYGICLVYTGAKPIGGLRTRDYTKVATGGLLDGRIPYLFLIALVLGLFMWFLYNQTRHGKYMYAIGGNENAAEVSGVNTSKTKIIIYTLAGALYGVAGILMAAKSGGASVNTAVGYELEAIAACTIGGVSTNGGVGKISGILIGVMIFELLKISLQFMGVKSDITYIVQGIVIIVAVALDLRKYLAKK